MGGRGQVEQFFVQFGVQGFQGFEWVAFGMSPNVHTMSKDAECPDRAVPTDAVHLQQVGVLEPPSVAWLYVRLGPTGA